MAQQELTPSQKVVYWVVLGIVMAAYGTMLWSGREQPSGINVASWAMWIVVAGTVAKSSHSLGFVMWRLAAAGCVGNVAMVALALFQGGYTFNLGPSEYLSLFGLVVTYCAWAVVGKVTGNWSSRLLFLGAIATDVLSYYPQIKQYFLPHEPPLPAAVAGWVLLTIASLLVLAFVERLPGKLLNREKSVLRAVEESAFSLELTFLNVVIIYLMTR